MRAVARCLPLLLLFAGSATAATHRVPGEFATIQAGIDACAEGDTVLVAPGTYTGEGNRDLSFHGVNLVLTSEAGAEATVIDAEGEGRVIYFWQGEDARGVVEGFTLRNGRNQFGGCVACEGSSPTLRKLVIEGGYSTGYYGGSGGGVGLDGSQAVLEDLLVRGNQAGHCTAWIGTGGGLAAYDSAPTLRRVRFEQNLAMASDQTGECCPAPYGGGAYFTRSTPAMEDVVFYDNHAEACYAAEPMGGGMFIRGSASIRGATFVGNTCSLGFGSAIYCTEGEVELERAIIAFNDVGAYSPHEAVWGTVSTVCCLAYGNVPWDWIGGLLGQGDLPGNLSENPMFCDLAGGDLRLGPASPCLPINNDCGVLIGAFGAGCENTPVLLASFTAAPAAGAVDLTWQASLGEFRLTAAAGEATWDVPWAATAEAVYAARDVSPQLAPGGGFVYTLEGREPGETWQLLRALTVTVPPAFATRLFEPHPNPFNPKVTVPFSLAAPGRVRVEIFDLAGRRVATLADRTFTAGAHDLSWDGGDQASGVYLLRFTSAGHTESKRLVLLR